ncbi:MAG: hypothetical protein JJU22_00210 [Gammaproteobacteria bacterium]|nr:hypothetical protein [Gammaproteobacteria bacterium]
MEPATHDLPDFDAMNDEELNAQLGLLCTHMYAAEHHVPALRAGLGERRLAACAWRVKSTAHWLNARCGRALIAQRLGRFGGAGPELSGLPSLAVMRIGAFRCAKQRSPTMACRSKLAQRLLWYRHGRSP